MEENNFGIGGINDCADWDGIRTEASYLHGF